MSERARFENSKATIEDARRRIDRFLGEVDATWKANPVDRSRVLMHATAALKALVEAEALIAVVEQKLEAES